MNTIKFLISYHNGDAEKGRLDMYDASISIHGFAKALAITTHALLNEGEVKKKGNRVNGASIYINPSRKGSFEELVTIVISNAGVIGKSVLAAAFWDLIKWTWSKTLGSDYKPKTHQVKKLEKRIEPFIGEIEEALESPLEQVHRPIKQCEDMVVVLKRPRVGNVITMDRNTLDNVSIKTEDKVIKDIVGNATRYNILTGFGKFYDDNLGRVVSFKMPDNKDSYQCSLITWSLHHAQNDGEGKIKVDVKRVVSGKGVLKRYLIQKVSKI